MLRNPIENLTPPRIEASLRGTVCFLFAADLANKGNIPGRKCLRLPSQEKMSTNKDKKKKRKKKTALVVCRDRKEFWTTQTQFWQWVREGVVTKTQDNPLTGTFKREHEELYGASE